MLPGTLIGSILAPSIQLIFRSTTLKMQSATAGVRSSRTITSYCRRLAMRNRALETCQCLLARRLYSVAAEAIRPPHAEGIDHKSYAPKIQKLVQDISQLSLLEVADLNELLKKTLNIREAPMMSMGGFAPAPAPKEEEEEAAAPRQEQVSFTVKLTKFEEAKKVQLIKAIKGLVPNMNLVQAKKFVESVPQVVKADLPKDEAEKLKGEIMAAGGTAEIE